MNPDTQPLKFRAPIVVGLAWFAGLAAGCGGAAPPAGAQGRITPAYDQATGRLTRLAFDAEAVDHHPDIVINYKRVTLSFTTHSEGGLTKKDFDGARAVDQLV
mgnify:CR=1 FL=1